MIGKTFGRLTVVEEMPERHKSRAKIFLCRCSCGNERKVVGAYLRSGNSKSCGCIREESRKLSAAKRRGVAKSHGASCLSIKSPEYVSWQAMKSRTSNPNDAGYSRYGAQGISVCDRWKDSFELFLKDMGKKPSKSHTIDRIDGSKDYSPDNCRWASKKEQSKNLKNNVWVEINGKRLILADAIRQFSTVPRGTVSSRISKGWDIHKAILSPQKN